MGKYQQDFNERKMFKAVCSNCGKDCELPFKPTREKSVYCDECFRNRRNQNQRRFGFSGNQKTQVSRQDIINLDAKLDKILSLLNTTPKEIEKKEPIVVSEEVKKKKQLKKTSKKRK